MVDGVQEFIEAIKETPTDNSTTYSGVVSRIDREGTVWVYLEGSEKETPTALSSVEVEKGETVNLEWRNNKLYIAGNVSNPSAGVTRVAGAEEDAARAFLAAENAEFDAARAHEAADRAEAEAVRAYNEAERATGYANDALTQLSVVEEVVDVLSWISEHGTYKKSTDTTVVEQKMYFTLTGTVVVPETYDDNTKKITNLESYYEKVNNVYVKTADTTYDSSKTYYTVSAELVEQPTGNPSTQGYYEIFSIDKAVQNYISSHLALTDSGLWVVKDNQGYKVLLANDGLKVYDSGGHLVSTFGESIIFDSERPQSIGGDTAYILFHDTDSDRIPDTITIGGNVVMSGSNKTLTETLEELEANANSTLIYDHEYVLNNAKTQATFTAHVYRGGQDVTSEFNDEQFTWYYKTEANEDPQPINTNTSRNPQNSGKTITVPISLMGYGGEVVGRFTTTSNASLLSRGGDNLTDASNRNLTARTTESGNSVRVRDLTLTTTIYPTDSILVIQSEEERLTEINTLADALWDKYAITIENEPLMQGNNNYEDIGLGRITNSEIEALAI